MSSFLDKYSWQQKNKALGWGALLFLFIVYQASIKKTLELRSNYVQANQQQAKNQQEEQELARLKERLGKMNNPQALSGQDLGNAKVNMLNSIAAAADNNGLIIKDVPLTNTYESNGLQVNYDHFCLVGSYSDLLKCWYEIEKQKEINLVSIAFKKEPNSQTRQAELKMYLTTAYVGKSN